MQVCAHQASLQTLTPGEFSAGEFRMGPAVTPREEKGSSAISVLYCTVQIQLLTFLPSKSADVNNSGRFSTTLILSSKWLALKILERQQ